MHLLRTCLVYPLKTLIRRTKESYSRISPLYAKIHTTSICSHKVRTMNTNTTIILANIIHKALKINEFFLTFHLLWSLTFNFHIIHTYGTKVTDVTHKLHFLSCMLLYTLKLCTLLTNSTSELSSHLTLALNICLRHLSGCFNDINN